MKKGNKVTLTQSIVLKKSLLTLLFVCILILCIYVIPSFCQKFYIETIFYLIYYAPSLHKTQILTFLVLCFISGVLGIGGREEDRSAGTRFA